MVLLGLILNHETASQTPAWNLGTQELHHPAVHPWAIDDAIC